MLNKTSLHRWTDVSSKVQAWHWKINEFIQPICSWQAHETSFLDHVQNSAVWYGCPVLCCGFGSTPINMHSAWVNACTRIYTHRNPHSCMMSEVFTTGCGSVLGFGLWVVAEGQSIPPHKQDLAGLAWGPPYRGRGPEDKHPGNN